MKGSVGEQPNQEQQPPSFVFQPTAGRTEWWEGDPSQLRLLLPNEPHPFLVLQRDVLSSEQCRCLIECFDRQLPTSSWTADADFWKGRFLCHGLLPASEREATRIMQQARLVAQVTATQKFRPERPIYSDTAQLVMWPEGVGLTPHADNLHPDGQPNGTPHRCYSSIIYLNDDYDGGETYFPGFGIRLKPQRGLLVVFGSGPEFVHGVTPVQRGRRFTYAGWFTFDPAHEDRTARIVF